MQHSAHFIILFDGICRLCSGIVSFLIKRDSKQKFKFATLQSPDGQEILKAFHLSASDFDTFILIQEDECFSKSTAALMVLRELGGIWKTFYVFIIIPRAVRDLVYNLVAKTRYRLFGKRQKCMVPTPEMEERFL